MQDTKISNEELAQAQEIVNKISAYYDARIVGQNHLKVALLVGLMANGHILLESVPGLAKTTAAKVLTDAMDASFSKIQCTPDLLPSDIVGTQIFNYARNQFETKIGPVCANFVVLDEINRSSAKTQSAMLEVMQERKVSIAGETHRMPKPFIVVATQNPIEQEGTYLLSEAQTDRFLLKEILTYPTPEEEIMILNRIESGIIEMDAAAVVNSENIIKLQDITNRVYADDSIKRYIVNLIQATRQPAKYLPAELAQYIELGSSPRGSITLMNVAKAVAVLNNRNFVTPDDVKFLSHSALRHRISLSYAATADNVSIEQILDALIGAVNTP